MKIYAYDENRRVTRIIPTQYQQLAENYVHVEQTLHSLSWLCTDYKDRLHDTHNTVFELYKELGRQMIAAGILGNNDFRTMTGWKIDWRTIKRGK